jgi:hypothetical protein
MPPTKNVGYGRTALDAYPPRHVGGRVLVVGASTVPGLVTLQRLFTPDTFGKVRYFSTLAAAVAAGVANTDTVYLAAGHAETISSSTALTLSVAGMTIVGLGTGSIRPTITLDTATTATINVTAANVRLENVVFVANFANIASLFTLTTAQEFTLVNCEVRDTSAILNFLAVITTNATSNNADGVTLIGNTIRLAATSGAVRLATVAGTNARWTISQNSYQAATTGTGAVIAISTGKVLTQTNITDNRLNLVATAGTATGLLITTDGSTNSGLIDNNVIHALATSPLLVTASSGFFFGRSYYTHATDKSAYAIPAADS